jgi:hypothetical protein
MDIKRVTTGAWVVAGGFVLMIIGMSVHWYKVSASGFSASGGSGWDETLAVFAFLITIVALAAAALDLIPSGVPKLPVPRGLIVMGLGGVSTLFVLIKFVDKPGTGLEGAFGVHVGYSVGIFLSLIASLVIVGGGFLLWKSESAPAATAAWPGGQPAVSPGQAPFSPYAPPQAPVAPPQAPVAPPQAPVAPPQAPVAPPQAGPPPGYQPQAPAAPQAAPQAPGTVFCTSCGAALPSPDAQFCTACGAKRAT